MSEMSVQSGTPKELMLAKPIYLNPQISESSSGRGHIALILVRTKTKKITYSDGKTESFVETSQEMIMAKNMNFG